MTQLTDLIADEGPLGVALVAEFEAGYTDVRFEVQYRTCDRCGAVVPEITQPVHSEWHRNTSFRLFLLQAYVRDHTGTHVKVSQQLTQMLDELTKQVEEL